jgi:hypothetical protein
MYFTLLNFLNHDAVSTIVIYEQIFKIKMEKNL